MPGRDTWARSVDPDRPVHQESVLLHLLVQGRAVDVEHPGGLLAIPVQGLKGLDDDPLLGLLERLLEGANVHRHVWTWGDGSGARRAGTVEARCEVSRRDPGPLAQNHPAP